MSDGCGIGTSNSTAQAAGFAFAEFWGELPASAICLGLYSALVVAEDGTRLVYDGAASLGWARFALLIRCPGCGQDAARPVRSKSEVRALQFTHSDEETQPHWPCLPVPR